MGTKQKDDDTNGGRTVVLSQAVSGGLRCQWVKPFSLPESVMETCSVVLTFESVDKILWCDHSNETSSAYFCMVPFYFVFQYFLK